MADERLRRQREELGLSIAETASLAKISRERVAQIEAGEVPFLDELAALSRILGTDPAVLTSPGTSRGAHAAVRFRSAGLAHKLSPRDARLLAQGAEAGRICAALFEMTGKKPSLLSERRSVRSLAPGSPAWKQGYRLGEKARTALTVAPVPIPSVQQLLEQLGVHVAFVAFESDQIEAASLYEKSACPVVLLNAQEPRRRVEGRLSRRAILAHEICHLLHDGGGQRALTMISRFDEQGEGIEQRANGFAPSFLAPKGLVEVTGSRPGEIAMALGETWGLSFEGAVWHAKNLGLITPHQAEVLQQSRKQPIRPQDFEEEVARTPCEIEPAAVVRGLLSDTAVVAHELGAISRGRLEEILLLA